MESLNPAPYSAIADALNKFHTASEPIQALALLCVTAMVLGTVWSVCGVLRAVVMKEKEDVNRKAARYSVNAEAGPFQIDHGLDYSFRQHYEPKNRTLRKA